MKNLTNIVKNLTNYEKRLFAKIARIKIKRDIAAKKLAELETELKSSKEEYQRLNKTKSIN